MKRDIVSIFIAISILIGTLFSFVLFVDFVGNGRITLFDPPLYPLTEEKFYAIKKGTSLSQVETSLGKATSSIDYKEPYLEMNDSVYFECNYIEYDEDLVYTIF